MTIQRQYSLPNCKLILEGLNDGATPASAADSRPLMSILLNAECHLVGHEKPLSGGREFFESLVKAVSRYAQEFFSGVHGPIETNHHPSFVQLHRVNQHLHRLSVLPQIEGNAIAAMGATPTEIHLTTVQLFDLVEAVDQFFADTRTLPDLTLTLAPVSRKYARNTEPIVQRSLPVALGVSGLALAAIAFFMLPIPEIQRPRETQPGTTSSQTNTPNGGTETAAGNPPSSSELETILASVPEIRDPSQIEQLRERVYNEIDAAWDGNGSFQEDLSYRVAVAEDGAIIGYKPTNPAAFNYKDETPLLDLVYIPTEGGSVQAQSVAQFEVVFTPTGLLEVTPWQIATQTTSNQTEITDPVLLEDLLNTVYETLNKNWTQDPTFERDLIFKVAVTQDGVIADYEAKNQPALDFTNETPLPTLLDSSSFTETQSVANFRVVFTPGGVLQVSPWQGYQ